MADNGKRQVDARVRKTRLRLRRAYFSMLENGERLNIAAISKRAGVTRGTFYQHYHDKDEFLRAVMADSVNDFINACVYVRSGDKGPERMNLHEGLEYLVRKENGFAILFTSARGDDFANKFADALCDKMRQYVAQQQVHPSTTAQFSEDDILHLVATTNVLVFKGWLLGGMRRSATYVYDLVTFAADRLASGQTDIRGFYY
ncbi:TetR/AcrR family transcriptional regulator [Lacticaseibacillus zhaodongensis]|uniref:TetR/AcrR family transcriptional regulator n=1 Tax=Lacticaseibacillus zhaodongensis TaxID=2668065 RepID=UPI0012D32008|nr:TetR/AcrR family transcriptional regulator [Lacticaseibacillus zhaodongensis]